MKRFSTFSLILVLAATVAGAQQPHAGRSFDTASIRPGADAEAEMISIRTQAEPSRIHYVNASLRDCIRIAYGVKEFQISGPDWMSKRFNIEATYPEGATEHDVPQMLQSLLRDRFHLELHRETKDHAVYALLVEPNGPKLKKTSLHPGEYPDSFNRRPGTPVRGDLRIMGSPAGVRLSGLAVTLATLSETLSPFTDQPVIDQTGLTDQYDIDLQFLPDNFRMRGGPGGSGRTADNAPDTETEPRPALAEALQGYGLKLERRKAPMPMLVIDHIEKVPTEN